MSKTFLVEVLHGTAAASCGCSGCGSSCSSSESCGTANGSFEEETTKLAEELKKLYGDDVTVKYINVDVMGIESYPIMDRVLAMGYPYPITLINGEPKFAGAVMVDEIKGAIEEELGKDDAN